MARTSSKKNVPNDLGGRISTEIAIKRLENLLRQIDEFKVREANPNWISEVRLVLADYYGASAAQYKAFNAIQYAPSMFVAGAPGNDQLFRERRLQGINQAEAFISSRLKELREEAESRSANPIHIQGMVEQGNLEGSRSRKIFVVHGHNSTLKEQVARFLEKLELEPVILHEQPNSGKTIIEKLETHAQDASVALILLTKDDQGCSQSKPNILTSRARQNVIFEWGYFVGKLGRGRTIALYESEIELPSDLSGVVYISLAGEWKHDVVKEFKKSGIEVDANRLFS